MLTDANKVRARRFIQAWATGNLGVVDELAAPILPSPSPKLSEPLRDAESFNYVIAPFRAAFPDAEISVEHQIAERDKVATRWRFTGTHRGELLGIPPTAEWAALTGISIHRLVDGRVTDDRGEDDALGLMR